MKAINLNMTEAFSGDSHRASGMLIQKFPFNCDGQGNNMTIAVSVLRANRHSPAHCHNFDQIRYIIDGASKYGAFDMQAGDCGYFPESVVYGPQDQDRDARALVLQFPGDSAAPFLTPGMMRESMIKLKARDPDFGKGGMGTDAQGNKRDSYELIWEESHGRPIEYAPPRYTSPIIMRPQNFRWRKDEQGREVRHLGSFGDSGLRVSIVRVVADGSLGITPSRSAEFWFLLDGSVRHEGTEYDRHSGFFFETKDAPVEVELHRAEFLVVQLPRRWKDATAHA
jgi:hypothetical protein